MLLCKDCKYCIDRKGYRPWCKHDKSFSDINPVSGFKRYHYCNWMRNCFTAKTKTAPNTDGHCKEEALLFKLRPLRLWWFLWFKNKQGATK